MAERAGPIVAVIPFGARSARREAGAWGRQIARRLVDRFAAEGAIEVRPVFLVAIPDERSSAAGAGYLVFGSAPDVSLAAQYGKGVGATHALAGLYREEPDRRALEVTLVEVESATALASLEQIVAPCDLPLAEPALARWLVERLGVAATIDLDAPPAANEDAYRLVLESMDHEVDATLLRANDAAGALRETKAALEGYVAALHADPACVVAEDRLLVVATESLERGGTEAAIAALEDRIDHEPRAWRAHYLLGELHREAGDLSAAVLSWNHADAVRRLRDADQVKLASLEREAGATASALARARRVRPASDAYAAAQELVGTILADRGDIAGAEASFSRAAQAGGTVVSWQAHAAAGIRHHSSADYGRAIERYRQAMASGAPRAMRLNLARALIAHGEPLAADTELTALLDAEAPGEEAAGARRLRFGLREPELERLLERAGQIALDGEDAALGGARADLERVIAAEPDLWEAHFGLGLIARRAGDNAAAEVSLRRALELFPGQPDAMHELGVTLLLSERANEALRHLEAAAGARPDDAAYLADAGFAHLRAGNLPEARDRLSRAQEIDRDDPVTHAYIKELARVEALLGRARS